MALGRFRLLFAFLAVTVVYIYSNHIPFRINNKILLIYILWCLASLPPEFKLVSPLIEALRFFPLLVLFCDAKNIDGHIKFISISLALILIPGMLLWSAIQLGYYTLPGIPIQMGEAGNDNYYFYNYFVLLNRIMVESTRFQSIFLEPGYLGTMLAFLLYANRFNWKKWFNWVLLLGLVLSQSLAGYVTFVIAYILYLSLQGFSIKKYVIPICLAGIFVYFMQYYNNGDNYINHNIVERLTDQSDDKYVFEGSIRTDENTTRIFYNALSDGTVIFGTDRDLNIAGAGYKIFFLKNGIIAAILYFLVYRLIMSTMHNRKYALHFLILIAITFWQAAYPNSYSWIIPYILGDLLENQEYYTQTQ